MKKFIMVLIFCLMFIANVSAKENKLYFTSSGDRLYYRTDLFDKNIFIKHNDMMPGKVFRDELMIENQTEYDYKLYLKVKEVEQSKVANELLENIEMQIYLDGKLIYDGYAKGLDYSDKKVNLQDAIYIGEYKTDASSKIVVNTKLKEDYANKQNKEVSSIEWEFYASYEELVVPINPDTGDKVNEFLKISMFCMGVVLLVIIVFVFGIEQKRFRIKKL